MFFFRIYLFTFYANDSTEKMTNFVVMTQIQFSFHVYNTRTIRLYGMAQPYIHKPYMQHDKIYFI